MVPPLVLDIDGTLTTPDHRIDPRVFTVLPDWEAPVVFATGKAFPYPIALAHFLGRQQLVIAENGGVIYDGETTTVTADPSVPRAVVKRFQAHGGAVGWGPDDMVNRWRETEIALSMDVDESLLRAVAADVADDVVVINTGYAYHVKAAGVSKGRSLEMLTSALDLDVTEFVAIGDSENDVSTFERVGRSYAVANADAAARNAADQVLEAGHMDGTMAVLNALQAGEALASGGVGTAGGAVASSGVVESVEQFGESEANMSKHITGGTKLNTSPVGRNASSIRD